MPVTEQYAVRYALVLAGGHYLRRRPGNGKAVYMYQEDSNSGRLQCGFFDKQLILSSISTPNTISFWC